MKLSQSMLGNTNRAMWGKARRVEVRRLDLYLIATGARIRAVRLERDISLAELAAAIGGHPTTVHKIETGKRNASVRTIARIALALDVSPSELMP